MARQGLARFPNPLPRASESENLTCSYIAFALGQTRIREMLNWEKISFYIVSLDEQLDWLDLGLLSSLIYGFLTVFLVSIPP